VGNTSPPSPPEAEALHPNSKILKKMMDLMTLLKTLIFGKKIEKKFLIRKTEEL